MLNINKLMKGSEIRVFQKNDDSYVCINGYALYRQELLPDTKCIVEPTGALFELLHEHSFIEAARFPHTFGVDKKIISLYAGQSNDGSIIVKVFDASYTNPFSEQTSVYLGGSNTNNPVYAIDDESIEAIVMPLRINWDNPLYSFLKKSAEVWYTKGEDALNSLF